MLPIKGSNPKIRLSWYHRPPAAILDKAVTVA